LNVLDLFSGIGGFSLGLERAGMRTVAFCERDEYCQAVLRKHWPVVPIYDDIHSIDAERLGGLGRVDLICGGFPCQPFSVAGKQRAQADDRHLWPEMRRVIALARPAWVIGENVTGLIPLALDDVLLDLENDGYATRTFVIPAVAVDARHRRDRVWIIACDRDRDRQSAGAVNAKAQGVSGDSVAADANSDGRRAQSFGELRSGDTAIARDDGEARSMADAGREGLAFGELLADISGEPRSGEPREDAFVVCKEPGCSLGIGRKNQGTAWETEPSVGRVAHGVPKRVDRLRALGNAVVPQVVEEIGRAIMRASH
jgi:DNA (cytosine-5)-methyltransferase 1